MLRKNIYKWHRTCSLVIALPVLLWAVSGFMHPVMTTIRPQVATQSYRSPGIDTSQLTISLRQSLLASGIGSFSNVRIVQMGGQQFYQVAMVHDRSDIRYFSTKTGKALANGDQLYARFLAKQFLEGAPGQDKKESETGETALSGHDCCQMATMSILLNKKGSPVIGIEKLDHFTAEYKYINRLLPVYKITFEREDGIRVYVETTTDRFGFAMDNKRAVFDQVFGWFHTWEWLNRLGTTKYFIMAAITLLAFLTTLMGLYIFFTTKTKRSAAPLVKARRRHRYTSLVASLFTLLFTFSGGFHAISKVLPREKQKEKIDVSFIATEVDPDISRLQSAVDNQPVQNLSLVRIGNNTYWQVYVKSTGQPAATDLMKTMKAEGIGIVYVNAATYQPLDNGDREYAKYLAGIFSNDTGSRIIAADRITKFTDEYGFVNKRLPVWKVLYNGPGNKRYYVETSTGSLAACVQDKDRAEGYSFALFHKHHFMDWGGKITRDISTMFWAAMQVAMVLVGMILYIKWRKRNKRVK